MKVVDYRDVEASAVELEGAVGCRIRWLVCDKDGAPNFSMRQFEVDAGGHTPKHSHAQEHEVFVLEGEGVVVEGEREHAISAGTVVFVQPDELHQFRNTGSGTLKFLCLIPNSSLGK